jgi:MinD-like ATPase involved in chromosome partitioning or flagellar assembly
MSPPVIEDLQKKIIVIYSPGGGNGKSEIAANLAYCLAQSGLKVWVLDANVFAPSQDLIFGLAPVKKSFSDFLVDPSSLEIPVYDVSKTAGRDVSGKISLTPSNRSDPSLRFHVQEKLNSQEDFSGILPEAIFSGMKTTGADILILDTNPSFERINEVWLGLTSYLLIISRINDIDLKNVRMLLQQENVGDIARKLIVFNNIRLDEKRNVFQAMENTEVLDKLFTLKRDAESIINHGDCREDAGDLTGCVEMYDEPILFSEKLARFRQNLKRDGLFVQKEPEDPFSLSVARLAESIRAKQFVKNRT